MKMIEQQHSEDEDATVTKTKRKDKHKWKDSETRHLLSLYEEYHPLVQAQQLKSRSQMWKIISQKLNLDPVQCENRFKTLKRDLATTKTKSGQDRKTTSAYGRELRSLLGESFITKIAQNRSPTSHVLDSDAPVKATKRTTSSAALVECYKTLKNINENIKEKRKAQLELYKEEVESAKKFRAELLKTKYEKLDLLKEFLKRK